jgi:hypothetical protein
MVVWCGGKIDLHAPFVVELGFLVNDYVSICYGPREPGNVVDDTFKVAEFLDQSAFGASIHPFGLILDVLQQGQDDFYADIHDANALELIDI